MQNDVLEIAGREFRSRLIVGTGKYRSFPEMVRAHVASGAEMVTVAVRRANLTDRSKYVLLPTTAGLHSRRRHLHRTLRA